MLLPFRWLLYGTGAVATPKTGEAHKDEKLLRRIRRITRWSEAVAPPRIAVTIQGRQSASFLLTPSVASGTLTITRHVAVYNKGPVESAASLADFIGVDVSVETSQIRDQRSEIRSGEITAAIDLFQEEYLMLLAA